jgi:hypothetical protein
MYEQKPYMSYDHDGEGSGAMLIEEAEKLYNKLAKHQVDEIITDYASSISASSLPLLPSSDEEQTLDNQIEIHKENGSSVQSESNDIKTND